MGFDEYLDGHAVVFIEWGDVIQGLLPDSWLGIGLSLDDEDEDRRTVDISGTGPSWRARWESLERTVAQWEGD
jgi:tRNA A37 threonylcarbamoyladenosine biosynthesis protein TsaE